jgi:hypothetical protein
MEPPTQTLTPGGLHFNRRTGHRFTAKKVRPVHPLIFGGNGCFCFAREGLLKR